MDIKENDNAIINKQENIVGYLQLIQEPISRMSTTSAIFKGFASTIVAGISVIAFDNINIIVLGLSFLPIIVFAILDIYYLRMERKLRFLYEKVINGRQIIDYSINLDLSKDEVKKAKARVCDCIKSPTIFLFYPAMIIILSIVFALKCVNKV